MTMLRAGGLLDVLTPLSDCRHEPSKRSWNGEFRGVRICVGFPQHVSVLWVFMYPTNIALFCLYFVSLFPGYHAEGYHAPSLPPRAITPVYTSQVITPELSRSTTHVHRVITPAISNSYFVVYLSPAFTPPVLILHHHRAPHVPTYSTWSRLVRVAPGGGVGGEEQVA